MKESAEDIRSRLRAQIAAIEASAPADVVADRFSQKAGGSFPGMGDASASVPFGAALTDEVAARGLSEALGEASARGGALAVGDEEGADGASTSKAADGPSTSKDEAERAFRKIERLAGAREQASVLLRRRLIREGFNPDAVECSLTRALACGLVDDARYADVLVRSRLAQGRGRRGIAAELADLGIEADTVAAFEDGESDDETEISRALALLNRRPPTAKNRRDAAYRRLVQKGFSASVAASAARLWFERQPVL